MAIFSIDQLNDLPKPTTKLIRPSIDWVKMVKIPFHPTHITLQISAEKATFVKFSAEKYGCVPVFLCPVNGSFSFRPTQELAPIKMSALGLMKPRSSWSHEDLIYWIVAQNIKLDKKEYEECLKDIEALFTIECMVTRWEAIMDRIDLKYTYCTLLNSLVYIFNGGDSVALRFV